MMDYQNQINTHFQELKLKQDKEKIFFETVKQQLYSNNPDFIQNYLTNSTIYKKIFRNSKFTDEFLKYIIDIIIHKYSPI